MVPDYMGAKRPAHPFPDFWEPAHASACCFSSTLPSISCRRYCHLVFPAPFSLPSQRLTTLHSTFTNLIPQKPVPRGHVSTYLLNDLSAYKSNTRMACMTCAVRGKPQILLVHSTCPRSFQVNRKSQLLGCHWSMIFLWSSYA